MSILTIRELTSADEPYVAEIDRLATADLRKVYEPNQEAQKQRAAIGPTLEGLVAVLRGRVVGVVRYRIVADRLSLLGLGVHPIFRQRGVATALIEQLHSIGQDKGCTAVTLYTVRETGNVGVFERMGFMVVSEEPSKLFQSVSFSSLSEVHMIKGILGTVHHAPDRHDRS